MLRSEYPRPPFKRVKAQWVQGGLDALRLETHMSGAELSMIAPTLLTQRIGTALGEGHTVVISLGLKNQADSPAH